jgi:HD superfamily phosphodiesterase/GNAT superfamily N-acetyltransferase
MDTVTIREAGPQDIAALSRLYQEFHDFHVRGIPKRLVFPDSTTTESRYPDLRDALDAIEWDKEAVILVATISDAPVAMAEIYIRRDEPHPLRKAYTYAHLQSLFVQEEFRGNGIGKTLLASAHRWAAQNGASEIRVDAWEFPGGPTPFYEHFGYRNLRRTLVRRLSHTSAPSFEPSEGSHVCPDNGFLGYREEKKSQRLNRDRVKEIEDFAQRSFRNVRSLLIAHDYKHVDRVRHWALHIARSEGYEDLLLVEVCALMHDIGLTQSETRGPHASLGSRITARFLREQGLSTEDEIAAIRDAIRFHSSPSGGGKLGAILRDADKLDALGAIGLMRAFTSKHELPEYSPQAITGSTWNMSMQDFEERFASGVGIGDTIVDQINFQISFFSELETQTAIRLAEPLVAFMRTFVLQMEREIARGQEVA